MNHYSLILQTASRILKPLMVLLSIHLLLRGHHEPGGGFAGGLMLSVGFCLNAIAFSPQSARETLHFDPRLLIAIGLLIAICSGLVGLFYGDAYMTGVWTTLLPGLADLKVGTPLLFDIGVYLVVAGVTLTIFFELMEERDEN